MNTMKVWLGLLVAGHAAALAETGELARQLIYPVNPPRRVIQPRLVAEQPLSSRLEERLRQWSLLLAIEFKQGAETEKALERLQTEGLGESHPQILALEAKLGIIKSQLHAKRKTLELLQKSLQGSRDDSDGWTVESQQGMEKVLAEVSRQLELFKK